MRGSIIINGVPYFFRLPNLTNTIITKTIIARTNIIPDQTPALKIAPIAWQLPRQNSNIKRMQ